MGWGRVNEFGSSSVKAFPYPFLLNAFGLSGGGQRSQQEAFTITPVNDPRKLELDAPARTRRRSAPAGAAAVRARARTARPGSTFSTPAIRTATSAAGANGTVTSECLKSSCCWFHVGCKKCAEAVRLRLDGRVLRLLRLGAARGRDQLTKLTLAILDYALHDPPVKRTKEVVYNIDEYGLPTTSQRAVGKVTAQIAIDDRPEGLDQEGPGR